MPRAWTTRFISTAVVGAWIEYVVPAGYRAVVRNVDAVAYLSTPASVQCYAADSVICNHSFPVIPGEYHLELRAVALAGEVIGAYLDHIGMGVSVVGYLFEDRDPEVAQRPEKPPFVPPPGGALGGQP